MDDCYSYIDQSARTVTFKLVGSSGRLPSKATACSAGYDLYSAECVTIGSFKAVVIGTNVTVSLPKDCYGRIAPRSSLAVKLIDVGGGVIDSDYTGSVMVILYNFGSEDFVVNVNDKIAQLLIEHIFASIYSKVDRICRSGGFGSTNDSEKKTSLTWSYLIFFLDIYIQSNSCTILYHLSIWCIIYYFSVFIYFISVYQTSY